MRKCEDKIRLAMSQSGDGITADMVDGAFAKLMAGDALCYGVCEDMDDFPDVPLPLGFLCTIRHEFTLEVVTARTFTTIPPEEWKAMLDELQVAAKIKMVCQTSNKHVMDLLVSCGFAPARVVFEREVPDVA